MFFMREETSETPVVRLAQQRCGRQHYCASQAIARQVRVGDKQMNE